MWVDVGEYIHINIIDTIQIHTTNTITQVFSHFHKHATIYTVVGKCIFGNGKSIKSGAVLGKWLYYSSGYVGLCRAQQLIITGNRSLLLQFCIYTQGI